MNGKHNLGECLSLDADSLPSANYLSPDETQQTTNDGYFLFVQFGAELENTLFFTRPRLEPKI